MRYTTRWRHHAGVVASCVGIALPAAFRAHRRRPDAPLGRAAGWALVAVAVAFPVVAVGLFEGAYNHVGKDAVFLSGAPRSLLVTLFPPPRYELPDDAIFEISGVLQVVPAALVARAALRLGRSLRRGPDGAGADCKAAAAPTSSSW